VTTPKQQMSSPQTIEGAAAAGLLGACLDHVTSLLPYLTAEVGRVPCTDLASFVGERTEREAWLDCRQLQTDHSGLRQVVESTGLTIGTDDPMVAASIFLLGYSYRLLTLSVACLTVGGFVVDVAPSDVAVLVAKGRPTRLAFTNQRVFVMNEGQPPASILTHPALMDRALQLMVERVVERHLTPLVDAVRAQVRIGSTLLWGNIASSASTAFRTMEGCLGEWVIQLGERFFEVAPSHLQGLGTYLRIDAGERHGWFWERTNCCLNDRLPGNLRCADCSLTPPRLRRAAYLSWLSE
jgi:iron complex transport system ATP-binding protein